MDKLLNLECFNSDLNTWSSCSIIGTYGEKSFIVKKLDNQEAVIPIDQIRQITKESKSPFENSISEYQSSPEEYKPCIIKKQKGLFYSLLINEDQVILSRQKNLRYIQIEPLSQIISNNFSNISIQIPNELSSWSNSESFSEMIKNIREENNEQYLFYYNIYPEDKPKFIRIVCLKEKAEIIKIIIETAIEQELKLCHISNDKNKVQQQIEEVQNLNKIMFVNKKFAGYIIGHQGNNLKELKKQFRVNIFVDRKNTNEKGEVKVNISGDSSENVEACAEEITLVEKNYKIKNGQANNLYKNAKKMKSQYALFNFYVNYNDIQTEEGDYIKGPSLNVIGAKKYIDYLYRDFSYCLYE